MSLKQELDNKVLQEHMLQDEMQQKEQFDRDIREIANNIMSNDYSKKKTCRRFALALYELQVRKEEAVDRNNAIMSLYTQIAGLKLELGQELSPEEQQLIDARNAQVAKEEVKNEESKTQA